MVDKESGRISIMILDRSVDWGSCFIHDFFYEPLIYDLLEVKNGVMEDEQKKKINLNGEIFYQKNKHNFFTDF